MTPRSLFRTASTAEAITWTLLIIGMVLKYITKTTDLGVRVFGLIHGVVFLAYVLVSLALWVNQRWSTKTALLALAAAVPPWATLWFDRHAEKHGLVDGPWRLGPGTFPAGREGGSLSLPERGLDTALRYPVLSVVGGAAIVAVATAILLWIGPPVPWAR